MTKKLMMMVAAVATVLVDATRQNANKKGTVK